MSNVISPKMEHIIMGRFGFDLSPKQIVAQRMQALTEYYGVSVVDEELAWSDSRSEINRHIENLKLSHSGAFKEWMESYTDTYFKKNA